MWPSEAKAFYRTSLMAAIPVDKLVEVLANAQVNPTDRNIHDMYEKLRNRKYGDRYSKSIVEKLREKAFELDGRGFKLSVQADPFCCVILRPIMLRAHQLPFSNGIVFVDSSGSCDKGGFVVTFLFGASKIGGVWLGCIIHDEQNEQLYEYCFRKLNELIRNEGFYGKSCPSVLMTDDSAAERNALRNVFPDSALLLRSFYVMQTIWRWLWNLEHEIAEEDRRMLMLYFRDILYAKEETDCELFKQALCESEIARKYINFLEYFDNMWQRRQDWWHFLRKKLCNRGHNTNNIAEVSIRVSKNMVLQRCEAFNATSLVNFIQLIEVTDTW